MEYVKIGNRKIKLVRGKAARVYYSEKTPVPGKPYRFWRIENFREKSTWHAESELEKIQKRARMVNEAAELVGIDFASPTNEEREAIIEWRRFKLKNPEFKKRLVHIFLAALANEVQKDTSPMFVDVAKSFLEAKRERGISAYYMQTLEYRLRIFCEKFKTATMTEITPERVKMAIPRASAAKTRKHYIVIIREVFAWYFARHNAELPPAERKPNPLEHIIVPTIEKNAEPAILSLEDGRKFFETAKTRPDCELAFALCAFAGLRTVEAIRLRWKDIKEDEIFLSCAITKTKIARVVPISEQIRRRIRERGNDEDLIFNYDAAEIHRKDAFIAARNEVAARAGITIPYNAFRHTAASALSRVYGNSVAADICGHDVRTAGIYYRTAMTKADAEAWLAI